MPNIMPYLPYNAETLQTLHNIQKFSLCLAIRRINALAAYFESMQNY